MSNAAPHNGPGVLLKLTWLSLIAMCCSLLVIWVYPPPLVGPRGFAGALVGGAMLPFAGAVFAGMFFRGWKSIPIGAAAAAILTALNFYGRAG